MNVRDHAPQSWFLLEGEADALFLNAHCNHSFIGYDFTIELSQEEVARYAQEGRVMLDGLAADIHHSVPILAVSRSPYKVRAVSDERRREIQSAIEAWLQAGRPA